MGQLQRAMASIGAWLKALTLSQRLLIAALGVVGVMAMLLAAQYASRAEWSDVMPGATAAEQTAAASTLEQGGMRVRVQNGRVQVPMEQRHVAIAQLAQSGGLPGDGAVLFSNLVEKQNWMLPKGENERLANLALQNELARVISNFRGVSKATVVIDAPSDAGMGVRYRRPSASVSVFSRGGAGLEQAQVDAIASMVASAKAGMTVADVSVIDAARGVRHKVRTAGDEASGSYVEHAQKVEGIVQEKILAALSRYMPGVIVVVNAQVDVRRVESSERTTLPTGQGTLVTPKREKTLTNSNTSGGGAGGTPGVQSNVGDDISRSGSGNDGTKESNEESETEYTTLAGTKDTRTVDPRGMATKVNVTINVPYEYVVVLAKKAKQSAAAGGGGAGGAAGTGAEAEPSATEIDDAFKRESERIKADVSPLVETAGSEGVSVAGMVTVSMIPVGVGEVSGLPTASAGVGGVGGGIVGSVGGVLGSGLVQQVVLGVLAVGAMVGMFLIVKKSGKAVELPSAAEVVGLPPALAGASDLVGEAGEGEMAMTGIELGEESIKTQKMLEQVAEMVKTNPGDAARLVNRWMSTEE